MRGQDAVGLPLREQHVGLGLARQIKRRAGLLSLEQVQEVDQVLDELPTGRHEWNQFVRQTLPPLVKRWQVKCLMRVRLLAGIVQG